MKFVYLVIFRKSGKTHSAWESRELALDYLTKRGLMEVADINKMHMFNEDDLRQMGIKGTRVRKRLRTRNRKRLRDG